MPNDSLAFYESIAQVSQVMLTAARQGDWDTLIDAEHCCAALIERVRSIDDAERTLDNDGTSRKREIIRRILVDDAEIRDLTQPWLRQLETHLRTAQRGHDVAQAYR